MSSETIPAISEVRAFHVFLEDVMSGRRTASDDDLQRLRARFDPTFSYVTPTGQRRGFAQLEAWLSGEIATRSSLQIRITDEEVLLARADATVVRYIERQRDDDGDRDRISTAVFVPRAGAPHGVAWIALHETWLPNQE